MPVITILEDPLTIADLDYPFENNVEVLYSDAGGQTSFELKSSEDAYKIVITAVGNNGLIAIEEFKLNYEPTKDKSAIVFGDSIVYGICANSYSFANHLNDDYDFKVVVNAGYSDYRLSTYDDAKKWLAAVVKDYYDEEYDFVLLEGGVNDVLYETPIGQISQSKNYEDFDPTTFIGGLECYLYNVVNKWPNAKIGYIITYYTKDYSERGLHYSYETYKTYYDQLKLVLDKWNIVYLDLFTDEYSTLLKVDTNEYLYDKLHLNSKGQALITPYIYNWMKELRKYEN